MHPDITRERSPRPWLVERFHMRWCFVRSRPDRRLTGLAVGETPSSNGSVRACATNGLSVEQLDTLLEAQVMIGD